MIDKTAQTIHTYLLHVLWPLRNLANHKNMYSSATHLKHSPRRNSGGEFSSDWSCQIRFLMKARNVHWMTCEAGSTITRSQQVEQICLTLSCRQVKTTKTQTKHEGFVSCSPLSTAIPFCQQSFYCDRAVGVVQHDTGTEDHLSCSKAQWQERRFCVGGKKKCCSVRCPKNMGETSPVKERVSDQKIFLK